MRVKDGYLGWVGEGEGAGQRLEQQAPERVDIGTSVDLVPADLLGRHVVDRPHQASVGWLTIRRTLRRSEIGKVCVLAPSLLVKQDV